MYTKKPEIFFGILTAVFVIYTFDYFNNQTIISRFSTNEKVSYSGTKIASKKEYPGFNQEVLAASSTSPSNGVVGSVIKAVTEYLKLSSSEKQVVSSPVVVSGSSDDQTPLTVSPSSDNSASNLLKIKDDSGSDVLKVTKEGNLELDGILTLKEVEDDPEEKDNKGQIYATDAGKNLYYINSDGKKTKLNSKTDALWSKIGSALYLPTKYTNVGIGTESPKFKLDVAEAVGLGPSTNRIVLGSSLNSLEKGLWISYGASAEDKVTIQAEHQGTAYRDILLNPSGGNIGIGTTTPTQKLDINADTIRIENYRTIASSTSPCNQGEISWDSDSIYICVSSDTWKKASLSTW